MIPCEIGAVFDQSDEKASACRDREGAGEHPPPRLPVIEVFYKWILASIRVPLTAQVKRKQWPSVSPGKLRHGHCVENVQRRSFPARATLLCLATAGCTLSRFTSAHLKWMGNYWVPPPIPSIFFFWKHHIIVLFDEARFWGVFLCVFFSVPPRSSCRKNRHTFHNPLCGGGVQKKNNPVNPPRYFIKVFYGRWCFNGVYKVWINASVLSGEPTGAAGA